MLGPLIRTGRFLAAHPLTRERRGRAFARYVAWQVRSRLHDELVVPWVGGTRLAVRRGMTGATGNIYAGLHEFSDMAFVLHFLRAWDLFVDVGANVGSYTILASGVCRARTVAFEPDPAAAAALRRNVQLNQLTDLVTVHEAAVGAAPGDVRFTTGLDTMNHVSTDSERPARTVRLDTLDRVLDGDSPAMIKLDVEGYELQALEGAVEVLAAPGLAAVLTEDRSDAVVGVLGRARFERFGYDPFERALGPVDDGSSNALFIRARAWVERRLKEAPHVRTLGVEF